MLAAHRQLCRIRRETASLAELPVAALSSLLANIHLDTKRSEPFKPADFCLWRDQDQQADLSAEVAAVALNLRAESKLPAIALTAWQAIVGSAKASAKLPSVRALRSDDERVWILAPTWEGANIRGGLVTVSGQIGGRITVRDIDRPLLTYQVLIPRRQSCGWLEGGLLLIVET